MAAGAQQDGAGGVTGVLRHLSEAVLNVLYVPHCGACDSPLPCRPADGLCAACGAATCANDGPRCVRCDVPGPPCCERCKTRPPPYAALRAPLVYGGTTAEVLKRAKFKDRPELARAAAHALITDAAAWRLATGAHMLVPVPLGRARRRQRGYNQSAVIAQALGRAWRMPVRHALRRVRDTAPQSDLPLAERPANVRQAFAPTQDLTGSAVLIDDVVTSGETAFQAAWALQQAGIRRVTVLAVARAPDPTWNEDSHGKHSLVP